MSRSLVTLSLVGIVAVAWQLSGQETKPGNNPAGTQSPAAVYQDTQRTAKLKILHALNEPVTVKFEGAPLKDVMEEFGKLLDTPIIMDEVAISDEGIHLEEPVRFQVQDVAARSALEAILEELDLTWLIENEILVITSATAAEDLLVTMAYDVSDLVELAKPRSYGGIGSGIGFSGGFGSDPAMGLGGGGIQTGDDQSESSNLKQQFTKSNGSGYNLFSQIDQTTTDWRGPYCLNWHYANSGLGGGCATQLLVNQYSQSKPTQPKKVLNFDQLVEVLQNTTSGSWLDAVGVGGTISEYEHKETKRKLLVIRQEQKVHREIEEILNDLRAGNQLNQKSTSPGIEYRKRTRAAEQDILAKLNKTIRLNFKGTPLRNMVQFIGDELKVPVYLDTVAISDEGLATDEPITFASKNMTVRSALKIILDRLDLVWTVRREVLFFTSATAADEETFAKVYDVSDVIDFYKEPKPAPTNFQPWPGGFGGGTGYFQIFDEGSKGTIEPFDPVRGEPLLTKRAAKRTKKKNRVPDFDSLIEIIQNETSGPWEDIEGIGGLINEFEHVGNKKQYLVIRQTYKVHHEIEDLLRDMRQIVHSEKKP